MHTMESARSSTCSIRVLHQRARHLRRSTSSRSTSTTTCQAAGLPMMHLCHRLRICTFHRSALAILLAAFTSHGTDVSKAMRCWEPLISFIVAMFNGLARTISSFSSHKLSKRLTIQAHALIGGALSTAITRTNRAFR